MSGHTDVSALQWRRTTGLDGAELCKESGRGAAAASGADAEKPKTPALNSSPPHSSSEDLGWKSLCRETQ